MLKYYLIEIHFEFRRSAWLCHSTPPFASIDHTLASGVWGFLQLAVTNLLSSLLWRSLCPGSQPQVLLCKWREGLIEIARGSLRLIKSSPTFSWVFLNYIRLERVRHLGTAMCVGRSCIVLEILFWIDQGASLMYSCALCYTYPRSGWPFAKATFESRSQVRCQNLANRFPTADLCIAWACFAINFLSCCRLLSTVSFLHHIGKFYGRGALHIVVWKSHNDNQLMSLWVYMG